MSARDELFDGLFELAHKYKIELTNSPDMNPGIPEIGDFCGDVEALVLAAGYAKIPTADYLRAAGWVKPRTITNAEELDALGFGVAVLDASKRVWTNDGDSLDQWGCVRHDDYPRSLVWRGSADIALPAAVLYEPAP